MVSRYNKLFQVNDGITRETITVLVESMENMDGDQVISIKTLEGEYDTKEEFRDACEYQLKILTGKTRAPDQYKVKLMNNNVFMLPGASRLIKALNEAFKAFENSARS